MPERVLGMRQNVNRERGWKKSMRNWEVAQPVQALAVYKCTQCKHES